MNALLLRLRPLAFLILSLFVPIVAFGDSMQGIGASLGSNTFTGSQIINQNLSVLGNVGIGGASSSSPLTLTGDFYAQAPTQQNRNIFISGGGTDQKYWVENFGSTFILYRATNDAFNVSQTWLQITRGAGATVSAVSFPVGAFSVGGPVAFGFNGGTGGQLTLNGATSGSGVIGVAAAAGAGIAFNIPAANGSAGNQLKTDGSGNTSWAAKAATQTNVSAPAASNSTTLFTMQGLAGSITPAVSGSIEVTISGTITTSAVTLDNGLIWQISHGTGGAPGSNAALTGTQDGVQQEYTNPTIVTAADLHQPFSVTVVLTGLTVGTAYWLDLAAKSVTTASVMPLTNVSVSAHEI
jgi:hypothetical protein